MHDILNTRDADPPSILAKKNLRLQNEIANFTGVHGQKMLGWI
jgi:hypothetical protein